MEAILDKALQKMNVLEQQIADYKEYQTKIRELEAYYTSQQWKEDFTMEGRYAKGITGKNRSKKRRDHKCL